MVGGSDSVGALTDVSFTRIGADGKLAPWQATTPLPIARTEPCGVGIVREP